MLHSMTGYGSNSFKVKDLEIDIEVTEKSFDDFAGSEIDKEQIKKLLGL